MDDRDFTLPTADDEPSESVTSVGNRTKSSARDRKRLERERKIGLSSERMLFSTKDWEEFLRPASLARKAGCEEKDLGAMVLKELVDNAADEGASPELLWNDEGGLWVVYDDGPGIDPDRVPEVFAVNRAMLSSKRLRMPTRGVLGNGLRVVARSSENAVSSNK